MTDPSRSPQRVLRWPAVWRAAVSTMALALPLAVLQTWLVDSGRVGKGEPLNLLMYLAIMSTGALGGFAAAKMVDANALRNGAAAAGLAALVIQIGADVRHLIVGDPITGPLAWIFLALLMATFGMFGAWVHEKTAPRPEGSPR